MFATIALQAVSRFIQVFSPSWMVFCALYFIVGMGQVSNYIVAFVLGKSAQIFSHYPLLLKPSLTNVT